MHACLLPEQREVYSVQYQVVAVGIGFHQPVDGVYRIAAVQLVQQLPGVAVQFDCFPGLGTVRFVETAHPAFLAGGASVYIRNRGEAWLESPGMEEVNPVDVFGQVV